MTFSTSKLAHSSLAEFDKDLTMTDHSEQEVFDQRQSQAFFTSLIRLFLEMLFGALNKALIVVSHSVNQIQRISFPWLSNF